MVDTPDSTLDGSPWTRVDDAIRRLLTLADRAPTSVDPLHARDTLPTTPMNDETRSGSTSRTQWSLIVRAGGPRTPDSRAALEQLCRAYLPPLRALAHRFTWWDRSRAEDLLQSFLADLIEKDIVGRACPSRGRFRKFLQVTFRNHAINFMKKERPHSRKPPKDSPAGAEADSGEPSYFEAMSSEGVADCLCDCKWATNLLDRALLRVELERPRQSKIVQVLRQRLHGDPNLRDTAAALGISEHVLKVRLFEVRRAFHRAVRAEVAETVEDPEDVEDELRELIDALRGCDDL
jgi:RNA polymerase sigma-70 factor (ECF subfamily)